MAACNSESLGSEFFDDWSYEEAIRCDPIHLKEIESFHYEQCIECNYHKPKKARLKSRDSLTEDLKIMYDDLSKINLTKKNVRLKIKKGSLVWHYICDACEPHKQNINDNKEELKKLVFDFLNN